MKAIKEVPNYFRQYHPKYLEAEKLKISFSGDMAYYVREFMSEIGIKTAREFVKYITQYCKELNPDIKFYSYTKHTYIRTDKRLVTWICDLEDETDLDSMAIICYYFENGTSNTRRDCLYSMFQSVKLHIKEFKQQDKVYEFEQIDRTKTAFIKDSIVNMRVGASKLYALTMKDAQEKLDMWYAENHELGNRYHLFEEEGVIKIYREL
jgi:hypothetical protein